MGHRHKNVISIACVVACAGTAIASPPRYRIVGFAPSQPPSGLWENVGGQAINDDGQVHVIAVNDFNYNPASFLYDGGLFEGVGFEGSDLGPAGMAVGSYWNIDNRYRAIARRTDGSWAWIPTLSGNWYDENSANGINSHGQVVGWSTSDDGDGAWVWTEATGVQVLDNGTERMSYGFAINDAGVVVGWDETANAALWEDGVITLLGQLGVGTMNPRAINNNDQVIGRYRVEPFAFRAFFWENGVLSDLGDLGRDNVHARDINDEGHIVGSAEIDASGTDVAILWHEGTIIDLNALIAPDSGWTLFDAAGINAQGQITGSGYHFGVPKAFVLTPTCPGDINGDGTTTSQDFIAFLNAWNAQNPAADWNQDAQYNSQDFLAFLNDWVLGCP